MNKPGKRKEQKGVITVLFTLSLLIVLTLITTMLEAARTAAGTGLAKTMTKLASESVLSSYYLPLYENYHIFGLWCAEDDKEQELSEKFRWYLEQNTGMGGWADFEVKEAEVLSAGVLTEQNGAVFYEQALEYAKYRSVELAAEEILQALGVLEESEATMQILQKKYEAEGYAAQVETKVLQLAGCVDGFVVKDGFFEQSWLGRVKTEKSFVKRLIPGYVGKESVGVSSAQLYKAKKRQYRDPLESLRLIQSMKALTEKTQQELFILQQERVRLEDEYRKKQELEIEQASMEELAKKLVNLSEEIAEKEEVFAGAKGKCESNYQSLRQCMQETVKKLSEAEELLHQIEVEKDKAIDELEGYLEELHTSGEQQNPELYEELVAETELLLEEYRTSKGFGMLPDIEAMEENLRYNQSCLNAAMVQLDCLNLQQNMDEVWSTSMQTAQEQLGALRVDALQFDYDGLFDTEEENSFAALAEQLAEYGIFAMVLENPKEVSTAVLSGAALPSDGYEKAEVEESKVDLGALFSGELEGNFPEKAVALGKDGIEAFVEQLLYIVYLEEHFMCQSDFPDTLEKTEEGGTLEGLCYQLEYIIAGKKADDSNLANIIQQIFLLRFALNLTTILCSKECRTQAKTAATAMIGFTGIAALVLTLQLLIELIWAAECAMTETAALLMGKECSFLPTKNGLAISFSELLAFGKGLALEKAKGMSESAGIFASYREYLWLFLLLQDKEQRTLRTMDLVQQTIQLKFASDFLLSDCVYSLDTKACIGTLHRFLIYMPERRLDKGNYRIFYDRASYCK